MSGERTDGGEAFDPERADWRVGTASTDITPDPDEPHHLIGFGGREGPMDGVEHPIRARAVAFEDETGRRLVVLSYELLWVLPDQRERLDSEVAERWDLDPEQLVVNPSHTHFGPSYSDREEDLLGATAEEGVDEALAYREELDEALLTVIGDALSDLEPADLNYYHSKCGMAMSRRRPTEETVHFRPYADGPVDHDVDVLTAETGDGTKAILFGYACHPTVGSSNEVSGDWPGYTMRELEESHPEATALFLIGCAGDQKAYPQSTPDLVKRHAKTATTAVERALVTVPRRVTGPLRLVREEIPLEMEKRPDESERTGRAGAGVGTGETGTVDVETMERNYPLQAVGFGDDLTMLSLSGEVLVEFALRLKEELSGPLWVAAYATKVGYIPTKRALAAGGYEARWNYREGWRYAESTEDRVMETACALAERVGSVRE